MLEHTVKVVEGMPLSIDIDGLLHDSVEPTHFIKPKGVVNVIVGKQNRITPLQILL
jgi:hypothetical protein